MAASTPPPPPNDLAELLGRVLSHLGTADARRGERPTHPTRAQLRAAVERLDPDAPMSVDDALAWAIEGMRADARTGHARDFGMFQAAPTALSVVADALVSADNPQLATYEHAPFAVEAEAHLVRLFARRFGLPDGASGQLTSGGAEANLLALSLALHHVFPDIASRGLRGLPRDPVVYASAEAHPTVVRAARVVGLGDEAVRLVAVDGAQRMRGDALRDAIGRDRQAGRVPMCIVATVGTTATGAIDPVDELADVAAREGAFLHVDAAWGGMLALSSKAVLVRALGRSGAITFDPHKALSAPLGTGMLLARDASLMARAFSVQAGYMPRDTERDPFTRGLAWSRRFLGLRVLLPLAVAGWAGLRRDADRALALGRRLAQGLACGGFTRVNDTPLPLVCVTDEAAPPASRTAHLARIAREAAEQTGADLTLCRLPGGARALRAAVTSRLTTEGDVDLVVDALVRARDAAARGLV